MQEKLEKYFYLQNKKRWPIKLFFPVLNWFWGVKKYYVIFDIENSAFLQITGRDTMDISLFGLI